MEGASSSSRITPEQVNHEEQGQLGSGVTVNEDAKQVRVFPSIHLFVRKYGVITVPVDIFSYIVYRNGLRLFEHC